MPLANMTQKAELTCTQAQFEQLHDSVARTRKNSSTVRVDIEAIKGLLADYSGLLAERE